MLEKLESLKKSTKRRKAKNQNTIDNFLSQQSQDDISESEDFTLVQPPMFIDESSDDEPLLVGCACIFVEILLFSDSQTQ